MSESHPQIGVDETRLIRGTHGVMAEPDDMQVGQVVIVGAVSLLIFLVSGIWAYWILIRYEQDYMPEGEVVTSAAIHQYEVGIVNQKSFDLDDHAEDKLAAQQKALNGYGYLDRRTGKVHVPVQQGMDQIVADQKARGFQKPQQGVAPQQGTDANQLVPGQDAPVELQPIAPGDTGQTRPGPPTTP